MTEPAKRLNAALFAAASLPGSNASDENLHRRLAALRTTAQARDYDVVLERVGGGPPYAAHAWMDDLLEAADAGTFHVLLVEDSRDLGDSPTDAQWLTTKLERLGVWIAQTGRCHEVVRVDPRNLEPSVLVAQARR